MKTILVLSILFSVIALPVLGELTEADLNEIRLIVQEEIKKETTPINTKIDAIDKRLRTVETGVAELRGRNIGFSAAQDWIVAICAVAAIVLSIIALRKAQPKVPPTAQDTQKQCLNKEDSHVFYLFYFHLIDSIFRFDRYLHQGICP